MNNTILDALNASRESQPTLENSTQEESNLRVEDPSKESAELTTEHNEVVDEVNEEVVVESNSETESVKEDEDEVWFKGEHSVYRNPDDAKRGIEEKDKYIVKLRQEREQEVTEREAKIKDLSSELETINRKLEVYSSRLPEDQFKDIMVQEFLPEEYRGKTVQDFTEDADLKAYKLARMDAELKYEREIKDAETQLAQQKAQHEQNRERANEYVKSLASNEFFDAKNFEDQHKVRTALNTPIGEGEGSHTPMQMAVFIAEAFGDQAAKVFLQGIKADLVGGTQARVAERVKKVQKPTQHSVTPPVYRETAHLKGRDAIKYALSNARKR
jgi:hypothetical protein